MSCSTVFRMIWVSCLVATCLFSRPVTAQTDDVRAIDHLIEELQLADAEARFAAYEQLHPDEVETHYLRSRLLFFNGDYELAAEEAAQALNLSSVEHRYLVRNEALIRSTWEVNRDYTHHTTADGHFIISYHADHDAVLVELAEETLERAYAEIGFDFGYWPQDPVRVEIYPRTATLAAVSSLTEEQIENSGTIALCKYNRLMLTSPRALVRGYTWRDTLAHEYVHLVIQHLTGTRVPIWLHEGLAKFEERRWRGGNAHALPPSNQDLLSRRVEEDNLITFEQMHPSMALLPTQEDSGTAFAEVYTVIEYVHQRHGVEGIRSLVWAIRDGAEVEDAIETVTGLAWPQFTARWEEHLRSREYSRLPSDFVNSMQFMPDTADDAPPDDLAGIAQEEARNFMHLGQLLRARDRVDAAIVEYRKAESLVGSGNPVMQNWLARALLDMGRANEAVEALGQAATYYPSFYLTFLHLGEANLILGDAGAAVDFLNEAAGINPFDPDVFRQLSRAYETLGESERSRRALEQAQRL